MENRKKQIVKKVGLVLIPALLILFLLWFGFPGTGLVTLPYAETDNESAMQEPELTVEIIPPANAGKEEAEMKAQITFEPVRKTRLNVEVGENKVEKCPETAMLVFRITNIGSAQAERLFVAPAKNLFISKCENCELKNIKAGETAELRIEVCAENSYNGSIGFYSLNAEEVEVFLK